MTASHWLLMLAVNIAFGLNLVAAKYALYELPPLWFAGLRFAIVLLVLLPLLRVHRGQMALLMLVGFLMGTLHFALITTGLALADDVSTVAILTQLGVPFATLMSVVFLGEVIRWRRWMGIMLSFLGVVVIGFDPRVFDYWPAVVMVVGSTLVAAVGMTLMKGKVTVDAFQLQGWLAVIACPTLLGLSLLFESGQVVSTLSLSPLAMVCVLFSALGASLLGHGGTYELLRHYDLSMVSPLLLLATVFGVIFGVVLLNDVVTPRMLLGGAITLAGALMITLRSGPRGAAATIDQPAVSKPD